MNRLVSTCRPLVCMAAATVSNAWDLHSIPPAKSTCPEEMTKRIEIGSATEDREPLFAVLANGFGDRDIDRASGATFRIDRLDSYDKFSI